MKTQEFDSNIVHRIKKISIAVLFSGAAILFYACESNNLAEIKAISSPNEFPVQEATNFETTYTDSGIVRFTLKTPKLLQFENDGKTYTEFPLGVEIRKYDANQKIVSTMTADYAKEFNKEEKWEAKNNVVVTNAKGDTLKTEHLIWDRKSEEIHTDEFVKIIREDGVIYGDGLTSDQNMNNWKIKNPKGDLYISVNEKSAASRDTIPAKTKAQEPRFVPEVRDTNKVIQFK